MLAAVPVHGLGNGLLASRVPAHGLGRWGGGLLSLLLSQSMAWAVACSPPLSQPTGWVGGAEGKLAAVPVHGLGSGLLGSPVPAHELGRQAGGLPSSVVALFAVCSLGCCDRCTLRRGLMASCLSERVLGCRWEVACFPELVASLVTRYCAQVPGR